jgi:hypothetical protein
MLTVEMSEVRLLARTLLAEAQTKLSRNPKDFLRVGSNSR